ncbi:MAG: GGDEF domain-containing protein [Betaproteobacteria bacterium HGW-Betaproteobacteria-17]|jgi:hemerythrin|nr:MAG: GGDEF domain-containing protein [Deltaproteobacteria bacterium HGW-Deltaproteobacteria-14]PKO73715.1 MAG: GGDEF domain-containing protein [Betaproteobacteria bacterium HGW-Betaproteobacteria-17]
MGSFVWSQQFVTGIQAVDDQHRHLVELINRYGELVTENRLAPADQQQALSALAAYADYHFREEDALMAEWGLDPRHLVSHRREHGAFLRDVALIAGRTLAEDGTAAADLLDFLVHWLAYHMLVQDQNMARQGRAIAAGATPAEAYEAQQREAHDATEPLIIALTGLLRRVSAQNRSLQELNLTLEARVEERTRALREANRQLEVSAMTDVLTNLPNRRHGLMRLRQLWEEASRTGRPLSCLMVDADGFKETNDAFGHDAGDAVLCALAGELSHTTRTDDVVCRLGGDEFLIVCPDTDAAGALQVGEQVRRAAAAMRVKAGGGTWRGSVSVGAASRDASTASPEALVKAADRAVYTAKRDGRDCVRADEP